MYGRLQFEWTDKLTSFLGQRWKRIVRTVVGLKINVELLVGNADDREVAALFFLGGNECFG